MPQIDHSQHDVGEYLGSWIELPKPLCKIMGPEHCLLKEGGGDSKGAHEARDSVDVDRGNPPPLGNPIT